MDNDEWGRDPSVQIMRKVFKEMETAQHEFLKRLAIPPYDPRIGTWREKALALFEKAWGVANRKGIVMNEKKASVVYIHCLAKIMDAEGKEIPQGVLPDGKDIEMLFKEALP